MCACGGFIVKLGQLDDVWEGDDYAQLGPARATHLRQVTKG
jgi:hypothetical protein